MARCFSVVSVLERTLARLEQKAHSEYRSRHRDVTWTIIAPGGGEYQTGSVRQLTQLAKYLGSRTFATLGRLVAPCDGRCQTGSVTLRYRTTHNCAITREWWRLRRVL
jgi:hypothetical protein